MSDNIFRAVQSTLIYIERGDEYLMLHRTKKENDLNRDKWIGVGGKLEPGEAPEDCALRETREETGLTLTRWRYRGIVTFLSDRYETEYIHLFTADEWSGSIRDCDEGELAWIKKEALLSLKLWEGDKIFLRLLDSDAPFFSLKLQYEDDTLVFAQLNGKRIQ
ncbi:MAG: 8-oxo-dGTP diphosphatase [Oscillospiraceae bacterium]|nr:8-oxo-dGTP diphosphatase [Oscillospiraceae bacterium]